MRGGGGQKMSVFVHAQGIKTVHTGGGGQKMAKVFPRSCRMTLRAKHLSINVLLRAELFFAKIEDLNIGGRILVHK